MAKTLIINNADFSAHKVETVNFGDIPCTGISLESTASISGIENIETLVPVVTPANTTDAITWESNHPEIASVVNGVVTSHRPGTATITALCGSHSATCDVSVSIPYKYALNATMNVSATANEFRDGLLGNVETLDRNFCFGGVERDGVYPAACKYDEGDISEIYPYPIPAGAKTITVTMQGFGFIIAYYNSKTKSIANFQERVRDSAKVLDGETSASGTPWSISAWTYDTRTFTISDVEGIDSFTLSCHSKKATDYENFNINNLSITFGYEAVD